MLGAMAFCRNSGTANGIDTKVVSPHPSSLQSSKKANLPSPGISGGVFCWKEQQRSHRALFIRLHAGRAEPVGREQLG